MAGPDEMRPDENWMKLAFFAGWQLQYFSPSVKLTNTIDPFAPLLTHFIGSGFTERGSKLLGDLCRKRCQWQ